MYDDDGYEKWYNFRFHFTRNQHKYMGECRWLNGWWVWLMNADMLTAKHSMCERKATHNNSWRGVKNKIIPILTIYVYWVRNILSFHCNWIFISISHSYIDEATPETTRRHWKEQQKKCAKKKKKTETKKKKKKQNQRHEKKWRYLFNSFFSSLRIVNRVLCFFKLVQRSVMVSKLNIFCYS